MPKIQVLDPHVADLIAAGEVVERPASVAKELMENAIDAGASKVTVEIARGGMTFLRVTDDGRGIPAGELKTAFLRHATSKLRTEYDLEAIGTLGFRGEALAAISAVSRVEVMSRTADSPLGASLALEGGTPGPVEEAGCPLGTTMVVRDLFYNTPARLKFMKKDSAEGAAVFGVVQRVALSHPEVSVKFIRDGKQELLTPGDGALQSAVYAVLGRELALGFREVKCGGEGVKVTGFVSQPACCRASRNWQFFFVNGRQVKSRLLMAALESPKGILNAYEICAASDRMFGVAISGGDFRKCMQTTPQPDGVDMLFARGQMLLAARAAGIQCFDTVFTNLDDQAGFEAEVLQNKAMGFDGKSLINPKQIRFVHQVFAPTEKEIIQAEKILRAYKEQSAAGVGVFTVDGKMIDIAFIPGAERTLRLARACGMYEGDLV